MFYLQAIDISGIRDDEGNRIFELALARNSWKNKAKKYLQSTEKPTLQQIQNHLKKVLPLFLSYFPESSFSLYVGVYSCDNIFRLI